MQSVKYSFESIDLYLVLSGPKIVKIKDLKKIKSLLKEILPTLQEFIIGHHSLRPILKSLPGHKIEFRLALCGKKKIQTLNSRYRNKNKVTDVLSFPLFEQLRFWNGFLPHVINLGDIFICADVAYRQAKERNIPDIEEFLSLFFHGFLHLVGYDHEISQKEAKLMFSIEEKWRKKFNLTSWV
jgi:probable rRNA maturation factor